MAFHVKVTKVLSLEGKGSLIVDTSLGMRRKISIIHFISSIKGGKMILPGNLMKNIHPQFYKDYRKPEYEIRINNANLHSLHGPCVLVAAKPIFTFSALIRIDLEDFLEYASKFKILCSDAQWNHLEIVSAAAA